MKFSVFFGAISGFLSVVIGAFAAHLLKHQLDGDSLALIKTAVEYQMFHAAALILTGVLYKQSASIYLTLSSLGFILGGLFFCGSLYALAFGLPKIIGAITPIGGCLFLFGWLTLAIHSWPNKK